MLLVGGGRVLPGSRGGRGGRHSGQYQVSHDQPVRVEAEESEPGPQCLSQHGREGRHHIG